MLTKPLNESQRAYVLEKQAEVTQALADTNRLLSDGPGKRDAYRTAAAQLRTVRDSEATPALSAAQGLARAAAAMLSAAISQQGPAMAEKQLADASYDQAVACRATATTAVSAAQANRQDIEVNKVTGARHEDEIARGQDDVDALARALAVAQNEAAYGAATDARNPALDPSDEQTRSVGVGSAVYVDGDGTPYVYAIDAAPVYDSGQVLADGSPNFYPAASGTTALGPTTDRLTVNADGTFSIVRKDLDVLRFGANGRLAEERDANGRSVVYSYGRDGALTSLSDWTGRSWHVQTVVVASQPRIVRVTDPLGRAMSMSYDSAASLTSVTDFPGDTVRYEHDGALLTRMSKPDGSFRDYTYDGAGRVTHTTDEEGYAEQFRYFDGCTEHVDAAGMVERHYCDSRNRETRLVRADGSYQDFQYDDQDNLTRITDELGRTTSFAWDERRNRLQATDPEGNTEQWTYTGQNKCASYRDKAGNLTTFGYDARGNLVAVHNPDGTGQRWVLDNLGRVVQAVDARGGVTRLEYDAMSHPAALVDQAGARTTFVYDAVGNLLSATDPVGAVTRYQYNGDNKVVKVTAPDGSIESYEYSNRKDLVAATDRNGAVTRYAYDRRHVLTRVTNAIGETVEYAYRGDGKAVSKLVGTASHTTFAYDVRGNLAQETQVETGVTAHYEYDRANQLTASVDARGGRAEYGYTLLGQLAVIRDAAGKTHTLSYSPTGQLATRTDQAGNTWRYTYDTMNRLVATTDPIGSVSRYAYDEAGDLLSVTDALSNVTKLSYDPVGRRTSITDALGSSVGYKWDARGLLCSQVDKAGNTSRYEYDLLGRLTAATDPLGAVERYAYDPAGNLARLTDRNGNSTTYKYDALSRLSAEVDPYGNATRYQYQVLGKVSARIDAAGARWSYDYDELGRLSTSTDPLGGRRTYSYDGNGNLALSVDELGRSTTYTYDALNRVTGTTDPAGATQWYLYDPLGNVTSDINPAGRPYLYTYDALSRLVRETDRQGKTQSCSYDALGNLTARSDFNNSTTSFAYDALRRLVSARFADGTVKSFAYDKNGNLVAAENPGGRLAYAYDPVDRLVQSIDAVAGETLSYRYDPVGNRTAVVWGDGRRTATCTYGKMNELLAVKDPEGEITRYTYDKLLREVTRSLPSDLVTERAYDHAGRLTAITTEDRRGGTDRDLSSEAYLYNAAGQRTFTVDQKGKVTAYSYDPAGRLSQVMSPFSDGTKEADFQERLSLGLYPNYLKNGKDGRGSSPNAPFGFRLPDLSGWDSRGFSDHINGLLNERPGKPSDPGAWNVVPGPDATPFATRLSLDTTARQSLQDAYQQIADRWSSLDAQQWMWTQTYSYDGSGNRVSKADGWGSIPYSYDAGDRLLSAGGRSYGFDANGNLVQETVSGKSARYRYTLENRLANAQSQLGEGELWGKSVSVSYGYDALGRRVERTQDSAGTRDDGYERYLYDGKSMDVMVELGLRDRGNRSSTSALAPQVEYTLASGAALSRRSFDAGTRGWGSFMRVVDTGYYHADILGSTMMVSDPRGHVSESYGYDAFGVVTAGDFGPGNSLGYNAKRLDPLTGLLNYGYRDYASEVGRWTTVDPIRAGNNWYAYVNGDPANLVDPWGLDNFVAVYYEATKTIKATYYPSSRDAGASSPTSYSWKATSNPVDRLVAAPSSGKLVYSQAFPAGNWSLQKSVQKGNDAFGPVNIPTTAYNDLPIYVPDPENQSGYSQSGEVSRTWGYGIHGGGYTTTDPFSPMGNNNIDDRTWGCIRMANVDVRQFASLSDSALQTAGKSQLAVKDK